MVRLLPAALALVAVVIHAPSADARRHFDRCVTSLPPADDGYLLAEFSTRFRSAHLRRAANVRRAAKRLHGVVIPPGGLISYNRLVGPRSKEAGFRLAPAIDRGKKVDKWGGGVCQPSSTLHAAALLSGLTVVDRRPHTWQSKYIASGFDATVVWGVKDLILKNPYAFDVRIAVELAEDAMTVRLVGARLPSGWVTMETRRTRQLEFETEVELDPSLGPADMLVMITGIPGAKVSRARVFHQPGRAPRREPLPEDTYYPRDALVRIGPNVEDALTVRAAVPARP